jgi:hypothetical protein
MIESRSPRTVAVSTPPPTSERDFLAQLIDLAHLYHWRVAHFRPAWTGRGWRTPVQGDGAGFPDTILIRPPRILAVELKSARGKASDEQLAWLEVFAGCGVETFVWQPRDFERIVEILR